MMVNGPLEIYSTVIGIRFFDAMFNILASMGIIFIPLLILLFDNSTKPFESEIENGASTSLRRVSIHFFLWMITVMLFVAPTWHLDVTGITYTPSCAQNAVQSTYGNTGTTYDHAFNLDYNDLHIPIMMNVVLTGMSGLTNAMITSLPCKTDVQSIKNTIDTTRLTPQLAQQVQRFENECFAPARVKFDSHPPEANQYQSVMNSYGGQTDLSWIGSHVFQQLYYGKLYPIKPVPGFTSSQFPSPYQAANEKQGLQPGQWGYPACQQWWTDSSHGLQKQLVDLASQHSPSNPHLGTLPLSDQVQSWLASVKNFTHLGSKVTADDVISRDMLYDVGSNSGFGRTYTGWMDDSRNEASSIGDSVVAQAGQGIGVLESSVDRAEIAQEIPVIQAVLLAFALMLGPLIIILGMMSGKSIGVIFTYYFLVGSLLFMTFIERFIHYLELSLHASQSYGVYAMGDSLVMYNVFSKLYFYGPMLYLMLMSIAGVGIGNSMNKAFGDTVAGSGKKIVSKIF